MRFFLLFGCLFSASTLAFAHGSATGAVKHRMDGMTHLKDTFKGLVGMSKDVSGFSAAGAQELLQEMARNAQYIPVLFQERDTSMPSEAKPVLWQEYAKFTTLAQDLEDASQQNPAPVTQIELRASVTAVGLACSNCHKLYRVKK